TRVENFILYTVSKVSVLFRIAQILEGKNGDALLGHASGRVGSFSLGKGRYGQRRGCSMEKDQRTADQGDGGNNQGQDKRNLGPAGSHWTNRGYLLRSFSTLELFRYLWVAEILFVEIKHMEARPMFHLALAQIGT